MKSIRDFAQRIYRRSFGKLGMMQFRRSRYLIASTLFLRLMGVVYLIAFISLWTQIEGLVGERGILPAEKFLDSVKEHCLRQSPPISPFWSVPTLAWFHANNTALHTICLVGTICSMLLLLGITPLPCSIVLWSCYLSLYHVGQVFLGFQWDILLLESGFLAVFLAPWVVRSRFRQDPDPPRLAIWLVWWLLFRLMFESGVVKLTWNDAYFGGDGEVPTNTWESLTAMNFHYWTQPLPLWTSWYVAKFPDWFQRFSVVAVLFVELIIPFFIFGPRILKRIACGCFTTLMLLIAATGNYNFFNLLTMALALMLIDDDAFPRRVRNLFPASRELIPSPARIYRLFIPFVLIPFAGLSLFIGALQLKSAVWPRSESPEPFEYRWGIAQFHWVNAYGLFRHMTETRPEIGIEFRTRDGEWERLDFRWKPGDLRVAPKFNTPHQPRLDWQMWFEALRLERVLKIAGRIDARHLSSWFQSFLTRVLENEPSVMRLLQNHSVDPQSAMELRITLYQYRFTSADDRAQSGNWWYREAVWQSAPLQGR